MDSEDRATGTNVSGYLSEEPRYNAFALADGIVYHTYSTSARGLEFLMGYYPSLDRTEGAGRGVVRVLDSATRRV